MPIVRADLTTKNVFSKQTVIKKVTAVASRI